MGGIYRPAGWANTPQVYITTTTTGPQLSGPTPTGGVIPASVTQTSYVFDAVLLLEHNQSLEKTRHPVQTGADISSHAYLLPARLSMMVLMSDAVDQYAVAVAANQATTFTSWTGGSSKSVSAYQTLLALQAARAPLIITTRLNTYTTMLITALAPVETNQTVAGLRARVDFEQIFTAAFALTPVSARTNDTQSTGLGAVQPAAPAATITNQYGIPLVPAQAEAYLGSNNMLGFVAQGNTCSVPGAGAYSSSPTSSLANLGAPQ